MVGPGEDACETGLAEVLLGAQGRGWVEKQKAEPWARGRHVAAQYRP